MEKRVLVIDRSKWARGEYTERESGRDDFGGKRYLLDRDGMMCCLGFDALAMGLAPKAILNKGTPLCVPQNARGYKKYAVNRIDDGRRHTEVVANAMNVNDDDRLSESAREKKLAPILKRLGYNDVQFVN